MAEINIQKINNPSKTEKKKTKNFNFGSIMSLISYIFTQTLIKMPPLSNIHGEEKKTLTTRFTNKTKTNKKTTKH